MSSAYLMPWLSPALRDDRESPALTAVTSALQLGLVVLVWLLALVPVALMALGAMAINALKPTTAKTTALTPIDS